MGSKPRGISASRSATVFGLNSFQTQFELWQRIMEEEHPGYSAKAGYYPPPDPDNASIRWGAAFEDAIIKLAEEKTGMEIKYREYLFALPWNEYLTCHTDGIYTDTTLHEGKTTTQWIHHDSWGTPGTNRVPAYVQYQVQHQLLCTGAEKCIVSVLVFPKRTDEWEDEGLITTRLKNKSYEIQRHISRDRYKNEYIHPFSWAATLSQMGYFHQYPITADKELHKAMVDFYRGWWGKHIIEKIPPDPENTEDLKRYFPEPVGTIVATEEMESLCKEYAMTGKEISKTGRLGKRRESLKVKILTWMKNQDGEIDDDSREKTILYGQDGKKLASWNGERFYCG